jgi:TP901 family phage tail tape measure protein
MKVADRYAELGLEIAKGEWKEGDRKLTGFEKKLKKFHKFNKSAGKAVGRGIVGSLGVLGGAAFALKGPIKDALSFEDSLSKLDVASDGAIGSIDKFRKSIHKSSLATGVSRDEIVAASSKFVALTGDGNAAKESLDAFARTMVATGATGEDLAETAAALTDQLKIDPKDFEQAFSILIRSGKEGAIEFEDMSRIFAEGAAQIANFEGGKGIEGMAKLSASLQAVRKGFGGPQGANKAATSLRNLLVEINNKSDKLKKFGVEVLTPEGNLRDIMDIYEQMANVGDQRGLKRVFGIEAAQALDQILKQRDAVKGLALDHLNATDVADDYQKRQGSASQKIKVAMNKLKLTIAEVFTPERLQAFAHGLTNILKLVGEIGGALPDIAEALGDYIMGRRNDLGRAAGAAAALSGAVHGTKTGKGGERVMKGLASDDTAFLGRLGGTLNGLSGSRQGALARAISAKEGGARSIASPAMVAAAAAARQATPAVRARMQAAGLTSNKIDITINAPSGDAQAIKAALTPALRQAYNQYNK